MQLFTEASMVDRHAIYIKDKTYFSAVPEQVASSVATMGCWSSNVQPTDDCVDRQM